MTRFSKSWFGVGAAIVAGLGAGLAIRYGVLEQAAACPPGAGDALCGLRSAIGWSIHYQLFGLGALLLALGGWLPRGRPLALAGLAFAAGALIIYNATFGGIAFVAALLAVVKQVDLSHHG